MSTTTARSATSRAEGADAGPDARSVLLPIGPHLVIAPAGDGSRPLADALQVLPPMPGALLILAAAPDAAPVLRRELPALARLAAERHATTLVLAASGLAAATSDGRRPSAHVARAVGLPVLAPDGLVSVETDGTLLVTDVSGTGDGSWWLTEPAGRSRPLGARWPATRGEPLAAPSDDAPPPGADHGGSGDGGRVPAALPDFGTDHRLGLPPDGTAGSRTEAAGRVLARRPEPEWLGPEQPPQAPPPPAAGCGPGTASAAEPEPPAAREVAPTTVGVPPAPGPSRGIPDGGAVGNVGGAEDREALKALLGSGYHRLASRTDLLATRLPGLRSAQRGDAKPVLVAVLVHHRDRAEPASRADLVAAARGTGDGRLAPLLRCLGPGLRMLPSHHGAVVLGAPAGDDVLEAYRPGVVLTEPAPVAGVPAHDVDLGTAVEFGVWSTTGRRTAVLAGPAQEPEVVFPPQSRFSVLSVVPGDEEGRPSRVLLRELTPHEAEPASQERDRQARDRLLAWFERRDLVPPQERRPLAGPGRFHLTPGVHPG